MKMSDYGDDDGGYAEEAYEDYRVRKRITRQQCFANSDQEEEREEEQEDRSSSSSSSDHEEREDRPYYEQEAEPQVRK